jgi:outer membrane protein
VVWEDGGGDPASYPIQSIVLLELGSNKLLYMAVIPIKQKEFETLSEKVQRDVAVMGETERRNAEKNLRDLQREVARLQTEFQEDLNLRRNEELGNLQRALLKEVQEFAQSAGFDLVVGDGVLYASSAVNITEQVLKAMEANFQAAGN